MTNDDLVAEDRDVQDDPFNKKNDGDMETWGESQDGVLVEDGDIGNEWLEIEGRSSDEAIERACVALNTTKNYLEVEKVNDAGTKIKARKTHVAQNGESRLPDDHPDWVENEFGETVLGKKAQDTLRHILAYLEEGTDVDLIEKKDEIYLDILSNGSGVFIGKHGQTLEALQHVLAKMLGLDRHAKKRIILDAEGYRARRQDSLEMLAKRLAQKARRERRSVSLEPMSAMDRRVVHMALANDRFVNTKSIGEGVGRRVVVIPKGGDRDRSERRPGDRDRGRPHDGQASGGKGGRGRGGRARLVTRSRMHDSFDVPPAPKMDGFPEDIDDLINVPDDELETRMSLGSTASNQQSFDDDEKQS